MAYLASWEHNCAPVYSRSSTTKSRSRRASRHSTGRTLMPRRSCRALRVLCALSWSESSSSFTALTTQCRSICRRLIWISSRPWPKKSCPGGLACLKLLKASPFSCSSLKALSLVIDQQLHLTKRHLLLTVALDNKRAKRMLLPLVTLAIWASSSKIEDARNFRKTVVLVREALPISSVEEHKEIQASIWHRLVLEAVKSLTMRGIWK